MLINYNKYKYKMNYSQHIPKKIKFGLFTKLQQNNKNLNLNPNPKSVLKMKQIQKYILRPNIKGTTKEFRSFCSVKIINH